MKVLIDSYDKVTQNPAGGIQMRIRKYVKNIQKFCEVKLFNKWEDKYEDYDILHIFRMSVDRYESIIAAKNFGVKIVISTIIEDKFNPFINIISRLLYHFPVYTGYKFIRDGLNSADVLLAQTKKEKNNIIKYYKVSPEKIFVIPNGCDIEDKTYNNMDFVKKYNIQTPYCLCVGRFDENKNQLNLIKALNETEIPLYFIGGKDVSCPDYYTKCKNIANSNIHFVGWLDNKDPLLKSAYYNAQVTVMPSYKETFGNAFIEGGCAGTNLAISSTLPVVYDYNLQDLTYMFNPNDIFDIKEKVCNAYYAEKDLRIKSIFQNMFAWDNIVEEHYRIYNKVMSEEDIC